MCTVNCVQLVLLRVFYYPSVYRKTQSLLVKQCFKMSNFRYITVRTKIVSNTKECKEVTAEVEKDLEQGQSNSNRRGNYGTYSLKQRYVIGIYAAEDSATAAVIKYSRWLERKLNEITVRGFKNDYLYYVKSKD